MCAACFDWCSPLHRRQGIGMEFFGVNNHGLIKLNFEILYFHPTSLG